MLLSGSIDPTDLQIRSKGQTVRVKVRKKRRRYTREENQEQRIKSRKRSLQESEKAFSKVKETSYPGEEESRDRSVRIRESMSIQKFHPFRLQRTGRDGKKSLKSKTRKRAEEIEDPEKEIEESNSQ